MGIAWLEAAISRVCSGLHRRKIARKLKPRRRSCDPGTDPKRADACGSPWIAAQEPSLCHFVWERRDEGSQARRTASGKEIAELAPAWQGVADRGFHSRRVDLHISPCPGATWPSTSQLYDEDGLRAGREPTDAVAPSVSRCRDASSATKSGAWPVAAVTDIKYLRDISCTVGGVCRAAERLVAQQSRPGESSTMSPVTAGGPAQSNRAMESTTPPWMASTISIPQWRITSNQPAEGEDLRGALGRRAQLHAPAAQRRRRVPPDRRDCAVWSRPRRDGGRVPVTGAGSPGVCHGSQGRSRPRRRPPAQAKRLGAACASRDPDGPESDGAVHSRAGADSAARSLVNPSAPNGPPRPARGGT